MLPSFLFSLISQLVQFICYLKQILDLLLNFSPHHSTYELVPNLILENLKKYLLVKFTIDLNDTTLLIFLFLSFFLAFSRFIYIFMKTLNKFNTLKQFNNVYTLLLNQTWVY